MFKNIEDLNLHHFNLLGFCGTNDTIQQLNFQARVNTAFTPSTMSVTKKSVEDPTITSNGMGIEMGEEDAAVGECDPSVVDKLNLTGQEKRTLYIDINDPSAIANDMLLDLYTMGENSTQDFWGAVSFVLNTEKYHKRIKTVLKYESAQFFMQRPEQIPSDVSIDPDSKQINYLHLHSDVYGESMFRILRNLMDTMEGKVARESDKDYTYRQEQSIVEVTTSFHNLQTYYQTCNNETTLEESIDPFLLKSFRSGVELFNKKLFRRAAFSFLDASFACICRPQEPSGKTSNLLASLLDVTDPMNIPVPDWPMTPRADASTDAPLMRPRMGFRA